MICFYLVFSSSSSSTFVVGEGCCGATTHFQFYYLVSNLKPTSPALFHSFLNSPQLRRKPTKVHNLRFMPGSKPTKSPQLLPHVGASLHISERAFVCSLFSLLYLPFSSQIISVFMCCCFRINTRLLEFDSSIQISFSAVSFLSCTTVLHFFLPITSCHSRSTAWCVPKRNSFPNLYSLF